MEVYLSAFKTVESRFSEPTDKIFILSSFFEHKSGKFGNYVYQKRHMLDSGAFSTFNDPQKARSFDWNTYVKNYIKFINHTGQKLFMEMDIDCVVGLEKVEYFRKQIEDGTGKQPIPVWHSNRKWEYWLRMCEEYPYVAIGTTTATQDGVLIRNQPNILQKFISTAHQKKVKIHGLGFTDIKHLKDLKFDSVDSTSWQGGRYGTLQMYKDGKIISIKRANHRIRIPLNDLNLHNFKQWVKFQEYAYNNL